MMNIDYVFKEKYIFVVLNSEHCFAKFIPIHTILQIRTFISKQDNEYIVCVEVEQTDNRFVFIYKKPYNNKQDAEKDLEKQIENIKNGYDA